jgi:hypothetical protein
MVYENETDGFLLCQHGIARIHRHARGTQAHEDLHDDGRHLSPELHLGHPMTVRELKASKLKVCHPDMCIYILDIATLEKSILVHMRMIACAILNLFLSC